jgi:hypothetical protein
MREPKLAWYDHTSGTPKRHKTNRMRSRIIILLVYANSIVLWNNLPSIGKMPNTIKEKLIIQVALCEVCSTSFLQGPDRSLSSSILTMIVRNTIPYSGTYSLTCTLEITLITSTVITVNNAHMSSCPVEELCVDNEKRPHYMMYNIAIGRRREEDKINFRTKIHPDYEISETPSLQRKRSSYICREMLTRFVLSWFTLLWGTLTYMYCLTLEKTIT